MKACRSRITEGIEHDAAVAVAHAVALVRALTGKLRPHVDPLEQYVRAGLALSGDTIDDVDIAVIRAADAAYGPDMRRLDEADLTHVWPEPDLDPSRPPRPNDA